MRLAFPRMFLFRFWCQPRPRICWPFRRVLGDLPPNSDLEQKGINEHSAFCCFFFPRKRIPGDFHLPKWTFLNPSGSGVVQAYWHQSEWRNHGAEADHCHDEISGIGAAGFFSIKKHLWSLAYSRSTITRYLSEVNFFFFEPHNIISFGCSIRFHTGYRMCIFHLQFTSGTKTYFSVAAQSIFSEMINGESQLQVISRPKANLETERRLKYQTSN